MKRLHRWAWFVGCVVALAGCKTWNKTMDTADKWWDAGGATLGIVRAAGDDVGSVFVEAGLVKGDADAPPAPGE